MVAIASYGQDALAFAESLQMVAEKMRVFRAGLIDGVIPGLISQGSLEYVSCQVGRN